jgi:hypothetical protein
VATTPRMSATTLFFALVSSSKLFSIDWKIKKYCEEKQNKKANPCADESVDAKCFGHEKPGERSNSTPHRMVQVWRGDVPLVGDHPSDSPVREQWQCFVSCHLFEIFVAGFVTHGVPPRKSVCPSNYSTDRRLSERKSVVPISNTSNVRARSQLFPDSPHYTYPVYPL